MQWPLREGDTIEIRRGTETLAEIPAYLVLELLSHHFHGLMLTEEMRAYTSTPMLPPAKMPERVVPIDVQEVRRLKRKYPRRKA